MNKLVFPQGTIVLLDDKPAQEVVFIVCGGRKPAANWLKMTVEKLPGKPAFLAADKGLDYYHQAGFVPQMTIGDGDSATPALWQKAVSQGKAKVYSKNKDKTDLQLLLEELDEEKLWIFSGIFGGRLDHLFSAYEAIGSSAVQGNKAIVLADERELAVFVPAGKSVEFHPPQGESPVAVSLLSYTEKSRVSLEGTKWRLEEATLTRADSYAISNEMSEAEKVQEFPHVRLTCHEGMTVFYVAG